MVKLEELEDEHFVDKPEATKDDALLGEDDDEYTDTDSEISDASDLDTAITIEESLYDRFVALKDMVPPKARARISNATSMLVNGTSTTITYGGKGLWVIASSVLLLGLPYALAFGDEQQIQDEDRQRSMMVEGAQGMVDVNSDTKPAL